MSYYIALGLIAAFILGTLVYAAIKRLGKDQSEHDDTLTSEGLSEDTAPDARNVLRRRG